MSDVVVPADWVAERLNDLRLVDVRDAWEYDGIGHLPGAVNVPFDSFRAEEHAARSDAGGADGADDGGSAPGTGKNDQSGEAGMLPGAGRFADLLSGAGIANEDEIVAYDDTHGVFAARFLVTAELYGHDPAKLHLLDGDFSAWNLSHEVSSEAPGLPETDYEAAFRTDGPLVDVSVVEDALDDDGTVLVDTREGWEYEEGHIPGAVRLDWRELVDDETRGLLSVEEIRSILADRGIDPERRILLYCNTARRISHTYTVLRHLGYPDLAFYEGSLTQWEREGGELETGS